jgi:homotetrameric cytidine deaminase
MNPEELIARAVEVRENACADYSHYKVGAALLASSGKVYTGCNIENSTYGLTVCAERVALWKALSEGERNVHANCGGDFQRASCLTLRRLPATPLGILRRHRSHPRQSARLPKNPEARGNLSPSV